MFNSYQKLSNSLSLYILDMCDTSDPVYNLWIGHESTDTVINHAPKKRGRPKGSPNKSQLAQPEQPPAEPKKRGRSADKHTRKSPKSTAAATTIQRYARRYINDYTSLVSQIQTN